MILILVEDSIMLLMRTILKVHGELVGESMTERMDVLIILKQTMC